MRWNMKRFMRVEVVAITQQERRFLLRWKRENLELMKLFSSCSFNTLYTEIRSGKERA